MCRSLPVVWPRRAATGPVPGAYAAGQRAPECRATPAAGADLSPGGGLLPRLQPAADHRNGTAGKTVPRVLLLLLVLRRNACPRPPARGRDDQPPPPERVQPRHGSGE